MYHNLEYFLGVSNDRGDEDLIGFVSGCGVDPTFTDST
jgi:hypothetical protein